MKSFFSEPNRPFIIAEIGGNHEGDFERARTLLSDAIETGVSAVKFQFYRADKIVSPVTGEARNTHFKKFELSDEQFEELAYMCEGTDTLFLSSFWDVDAISRYDRLVRLHKVGSGDLTNYPLLKALVLTEKPIILSTAMSTLDEVVGAVEFIESQAKGPLDKDSLAILHCVAMYGDPKDEYANLAAINVLKQRFPNYTIGYSDHTIGSYACELAMAMGACIIEKHFTDERRGEFRDHEISLDKVQMAEFVKQCTRIATLLGEHQKVPIEPIENEERIAEFRRAVYLKQDVEAGTVLSEELVTTLRPNVGIDARRFFKVVGKKLKTAKKAFEPLDDSELE